MQFFTDDHRSVRLSRQAQQPSGVVPKLNDPEIVSLMGNRPHTVKAPKVEKFKPKS